MDFKKALHQFKGMFNRDRSVLRDPSIQRCVINQSKEPFTYFNLLRCLPVGCDRLTAANVSHAYKRFLKNIKEYDLYRIVDMTKSGFPAIKNWNGDNLYMLSYPEISSNYKSFLLEYSKYDDRVVAGSAVTILNKFNLTRPIAITCFYLNKTQHVASYSAVRGDVWWDTVNDVLFSFNRQLLCDILNTTCK